MTPQIGQKILFCECTHDYNLPETDKNTILEHLKKIKCDLFLTKDLCGLAAIKDSRLKTLIDSAPLTIMACYPRAIKHLLQSAGIDLSHNDVTLINLRGTPPDSVIKHLGTSHNKKNSASIQALDEKGSWIPWFPVIDADRCQDCGQCSSFCLFGVYEKNSKGKVAVVQPDKCKTNCPACARICPDAAIIFPKIAESPINGDEIHNEDAIRAQIKINVDQILGDDIYATLAERRRKASKLRLRRQSLEKAQEERRKHTNEETDSLQNPIQSYSQKNQGN